LRFGHQHLVSDQHQHDKHQADYKIFIHSKLKIIEILPPS
jgi:hypothetical protein